MRTPKVADVTGMERDIYEQARNSAVRPEDDQEVLKEIWRVLMEHGHAPNNQTHLQACLIMSECKPKHTHEKDGERLVAFMPFISGDFSKDFACRLFLKSEADLLKWYSTRHGVPIEQLTATYDHEGKSNPLTGWDNRFVFICIPGREDQPVGILDGDFPEPELKKHAKPVKPSRHREEQLEM
ncbi:hypothetical protein F3I62_19000 [Pseudomonas sp. R-28-1W-6]|uniref:hypothetical protein n=1 Tax=Pseudomonas sp. R-28-1W-6 TaxID=2650101 RepID=UPI001365F172|nr:hypothetical protein [Pseudomonas sp. R-28-1W-6]MWV14194.1 hypothetical protein [Pseudomonas sp. R-28-1W-6]